MARKGGTYWAATYIYWESIEDDYEQGELSKSNVVLSEHFFVKKLSPELIIKELASRYGLPENLDAWAAFDGRLECQFMVDDDNMQPSDRDIAEWKAGRKRLWSAHVDVEVARVTYPSTETIAMDFGIEDMGDVE